MLYSFYYTPALDGFLNVTAAQPQCCIAYWGAAWTFTHPIWDFISDERLARARAFSRDASDCVARAGASVRERAYIEALRAYVAEDARLDAAPALRLARWRDATRDLVYAPFGADDENAGVLYGLSLLAVGYYSESEPAEDYPHLRAAGALEDAAIARNPASPGALHFAIHSYDQPPLAAHALDAAKAYAHASVAVPHALHMPSHIFTDLGNWTDAVASNVASTGLGYKLASGQIDNEARPDTTR